MSAQRNQNAPLEAEAAAAEATVVGEIVATELADALDTLWMALDDQLVYRGVSEESVAAALRPYGLSEAWLREWCGSVAARSDSPSPVVAEEFLVWIDEVLEEGKRHDRP
ncbi:MAG: hypothetical protein ACRDTJ_24950 [Pseudonocardiaceae bacterium]